MQSTHNFKFQTKATSKECEIEITLKRLANGFEELLPFAPLKKQIVEDVDAMASVIADGCFNLVWTVISSFLYFSTFTNSANWYWRKYRRISRHVTYKSLFQSVCLVLNQILISGNEEKFWADLDLCVLCITNVVVVFLFYRLKW